MNTFPFDTSNYPTSLGSLIPESEESPIDEGNAVADMVPVLRSLDLDFVFSPEKIVDYEMARACHAGLWLVHNFLDESHSISQDLKQPTGSFWHGIMHRREGDFSNAKYWFRNAGQHPVFAQLGGDVAEIVGNIPDAKASLTDEAGNLDPFVFVDWCNAAARGDSSQDEVLKKLTRREWERLFDWCYRQAVGK